MTSNPLGITDDPAAQPDEAAAGSSAHISTPSIVDTIFDLNALMSADVRRAEKSARFATRADLEADIENLNAELDALTDGQGRPLAVDEASMEDGARSARAVALELEAKRREYAASIRTIRVRQLPEDDWQAFLTKHKAALAQGEPYPPAMWDELIATCAIAPKMTEDHVRAFRAKYGHTAYGEVCLAAWRVNASSGVSVPKSSLSSAVLIQTEPEQS